MKCAWPPPYLLLLCLEARSVFLLENSKPNFVLMMVDDLGIGDLGCYGNATLSTPHIDRLAQEGVRLTHHIAAAPLCTPSRAAFLTGRYPIRSGMVSKGRIGVFLFSASSGGLPSREISFAKIAKQQGYETALIGKWHLGLNCENSNDHCHHPSVHGFDHFYGLTVTNLRDCQPGHGTVFSELPPILFGTFCVAVLTVAFIHYAGVATVRRALVLGLVLLSATVAGLLMAFLTTFPNFNCLLMRDHEVVEQPYVSENLTQRMTHEAMDFIERNSERPFLLFLSFVQVHTAMFASAPFRGRSGHGIYGDAVQEVDWSVGQIMQTLDRLKLRENTLVYLTSDQGPHLEEISSRGEVHRGWSGIYKGGKSTNWEGGIRVPGILSWPGKLPASKWVDEPTSNMDLFPTVVRLTGATVPDDREIDGHDLMALLQGKAERSNHEFLFHYCNAYLNAVRWHPRNSSAVWKAFYFTPDFYPENETVCSHTQVCLCSAGYVTYHNPPLLFDLSRDPSETTPLTPATEPTFHAVLAAMGEAVERHRNSVEPVENQMSVGNLVWKPWLQPCCSSLAQLCRCLHDDH
ncbi:steryl-sulfatase [Lampris incognitus]|uniref:steryl-sulfatase n=1 Tax=Lampris incognitus TaxID=2546036 RepID=UPI0024B4920A|nr:steryl-sulfatase [Lampris incognitus]